MPSIDPALVASELRVVLGQLVRRLRAENRLPLPHSTVLARLDREGTSSVSELATAERIRPQSMAQTISELEAEGLVTRKPDPTDKRRALIELTDQGHATLQNDRRQRDGWLAQTIVEQLDDEAQTTLTNAVAIMRRLAES